MGRLPEQLQDHCTGCGILSCQKTDEGWQVSDGVDRSVIFSSGLDCLVRENNDEAVKTNATPDELKIYMLRLLQNIGMPDIARDLDNGTKSLATPSENNLDG